MQQRSEDNSSCKNWNKMNSDWICFFFYFREMLEESCMTVNTLEEVARIDFEFIGEEQILEVHVFQTDDFTGEPTETEGKW